MVEPSGRSDSILVHSFRKAYLYQLCARHRIQYCRRYCPQAQGPTPSRRGGVNVLTGPCNSGTNITLEGSIWGAGDTRDVLGVREAWKQGVPAELRSGVSLEETLLSRHRDMSSWCVW